MFLMTEYLENTRIIQEKVENGKSKLFIEGVFMQANQKNRNGRVYPSSVLTNQVNEYVKNYVNTSRAIGELNHPKSPSVDPERACHLIKELKAEGNNYIGKSIVLDTPMGNIVRGLIEGGVRMGVSSRGLGSLKANKQGINEVQSDFKLVTVDVVSDPSAPDAFVNGIMEGVDWIWDNGRLAERKINVVKKQILRTPTKKLEAIKLNALETLLREM